ncbi:hypothetical protein BU25DRAFT_416944 [Macroventuria anomochaeta]|uniref:Uncharacterized protein n=1 Tax=Macroventuria anomochaeta TaxID=301207 RepID=A0ACB6SHZ4_9PLEO|nr:uncharacterized protein BU25DRAFT_416944 [Macroventuria anomochaeta]KAF2633791.1 hypothetical protein BU25DRAFT_416944 [Macroventuria anomochaeta]
MRCVIARVAVLPVFIACLIILKTKLEHLHVVSPACTRPQHGQSKTIDKTKRVQGTNACRTPFSHPSLPERAWVALTSSPAHPSSSQRGRRSCNAELIADDSSSTCLEKKYSFAIELKKPHNRVL